MYRVSDALKANQAYAKDFSDGDVPVAPALKLAVLTCMDARVTPEDFLDLAIGDAHILRNAGAVVTDDVIRSIVLSTRLMGTRQIFVIGHTQCALERAREQHLRVKTQSGLTFGAFDSLEEHVRTQVDRIKSNRELPDGLTVHGFAYQVEDGRLREVV